MRGDPGAEDNLLKEGRKTHCATGYTSLWTVSWALSDTHMWHNSLLNHILGLVQHAAQTKKQLQCYCLSTLGTLPVIFLAAEGIYPRKKVTYPQTSWLFFYQLPQKWCLHQRCTGTSLAGWPAGCPWTWKLSLPCALSFPTGTPSVEEEQGWTSVAKDSRS